MKPDLDSLIQEWRDEAMPSQTRLNEIREAAKEELTVDWWKSVLTIPRSIFFGKAA